MFWSNALAKVSASCRKIDTIETYPASEGFIAYQDSQTEEGLLLNTNAGIFYEFVPANEMFNDNPSRLTLAEVEIGVNYAIILTTNAGLYGYIIGDTVKFVSKDPYRIIVSGRIKHFISAFGEHVIGEEVEKAMLFASSKHQLSISEFTVAPQVTPVEGELPYHEWLLAMDVMPSDMETFAEDIDQQMRKLNIYYDDLRRGSILQRVKITPLQGDAFIQYMKSVGKLGGQNKVPRLSNDRNIADALQAFKR
jgi:hypothetical protein